MIEALVGTEHHSATRQAFFHSSLVSFLFRGLDILEAVRAFDNTIGTVGFVVGNILAEDRSLTILAIQNLQLAFLTENKRNGTKTLTKRKEELEKKPYVQVFSDGLEFFAS
jgi:hypothetical protein